MNGNKSIIDKVLSIAGVEVCAISSIDGEVLQSGSKNSEIAESDIKNISLELSRLFASYGISSIDITSLYMNFELHNIIVHGFGSGFIFIASTKNSNINLLKMETSYLEEEFVKVISQSLGSAAPKLSTTGQEGASQFKQGSDLQESLFFGENPPVSAPEPAAVPLKKILAIKELFSNSLGPIASMIFESKLKESNMRVDSFNNKNVYEFISLLANEIESKPDKVSFVKNVENILKL